MRYSLLKMVLPMVPVVASAALLERFEYGGHTYDIYSDARTWAVAQTTVQGLDVAGSSGYLWNVNSLAENAYVFSKIQAHGASFTALAPDGGGARYLWLGASDAVVEGTWRWTADNVNFWTGQGAGGANNGVAVGGLYNNWGGTSFGGALEPDDYLNNQDAAAMALDDWPLGVAGEWNDIAATNTMPYVVEYNAVAIPEAGTYAGMVVVVGLAMGVVRRRRVRR